MKTAKQKNCKICQEPFLPWSTTQTLCSYTCALEDTRRKAKKAEARERKEWNKRKRAMRENLKTASDYRKELEHHFNKYIRLRDRGKPCISCDTILDPERAKYDAGHFMSKGHYPELAFIEDNVHGQCVECNRWRGGNYHEYEERLIIRIGEARFQQLKVKKNIPVHYSVQDYKDLILYYKGLFKKLKNDL